MSLSATLFGENSLIFRVTNVLGLGIPGLLHKTFGPGEPEPQRLGEISRQTAKEGDPRVIVWGRVRPIGGNIIHCQTPVKRMVKQSSGGGKGGGGKKTQKVEHVFRTYAIGVCEGPITGFSRIWRNNKLVYDARGNEWGERNNPIFLKTFRLYLGGWDQMPDPTLQSIWGVDSVPAYRGTAYMVSIDEDLTDQGGMVPQWQFEVERAEGVVYTSKPYALESVESIEVEAALERVRLTAPIESVENMSIAAALDSLLWRDQVRELEGGGESMTVTGAALDGMHWRSTLAEYTAEPESMNVTGASLEALKWRVAVIPYSHPDSENLDITGAALEGVNWHAP